VTRFNIPFIKYFRYAIIISFVIILAGIIALFSNGLNRGIDFTGGTILHLRLGEGYQMNEVRNVLAPYDLSGVPLQRAGGDQISGNEVIIKAPHLEEPIRQEIITSFMEKWPEMTTEDILRVDNVGAVIGGELTREAFLALFIAAIGMIIYITLRFEFKFSLAAILALLHDAFVIIAIFSIFRVEINSPFIAAVLTIIGYSINDTIIIFDRIRENMKIRRQKPIEEVVNESINETLTRTIGTSVTTLLVLISLFVAFNYFVGGMDLKAFSLALLIGVISGTYSSIFIAGPLWAFWRSRGMKREKTPA
jgi:preprotein translocase SecF subunit